MRFSVASAVFILATSVVARDCTPGLNYCDWNLMKIGNYKDTIVAELNRVNQAPDSSHMYNDLYHCKDGKGGISYSKQCHGDNTCQDGGSGKDDFC